LIKIAKMGMDVRFLPFLVLIFVSRPPLSHSFPLLSTLPRSPFPHSFSALFSRSEK
jgi:hypothetical protein